VSLRDLTNGTNYEQSSTALHSDVPVASRHVGTSPTTCPLPFFSHSPALHLPPCPLVQAFLRPCRRELKDPGAQYTYVISSTNLLFPPLIPAIQAMQHCQPFLQVQCPPQHPPCLRATLQRLPAVKDPTAQSISATPPTPLLLLHLILLGQSPPPTRRTPVLPLVRTFLSPSPVAVNHPAGQAPFAAQLTLLLRHPRLAPQAMCH
jgi:hypothetical protein